MGKSWLMLSLQNGTVCLFNRRNKAYWEKARRVTLTQLLRLPAPSYRIFWFQHFTSIINNLYGNHQMMKMRSQIESQAIYFLICYMLQFTLGSISRPERGRFCTTAFQINVCQLCEILSIIHHCNSSKMVCWCKLSEDMVIIWAFMWFTVLQNGK